jgi:hypothetical protein
VTTTYRPITVIQPGLVLFDCFGGMHMQHWVLDLGGRALRSDWQTAYREEIAEAVAAYIARRCARMEPMVSAAADLECAQLLQRLQHRGPDPGAFRRSWWRGVWRGFLGVWAK